MHSGMVILLSICQSYFFFKVPVLSGSVWFNPAKKNPRPGQTVKPLLLGAACIGGSKRARGPVPAELGLRIAGLQKQEELPHKGGTCLKSVKAAL